MSIENIKYLKVFIVTILFLFIGYLMTKNVDVSLNLDTGDGHGGHDMHSMERIEASAELLLDGPIIAGEDVELSFYLEDNKGKSIGDLMVHHGRTVHTLIISEDLDIVGHVHPEDFGEQKITTYMKDNGIYPVYYTFPKAGRYLIAIDIMKMEGVYSKQFVVDVEGDSSIGKFKFDPRTEKNFIGYEEEGPDQYTKPNFMSESNVESGGYKVTFSSMPEHIHTGDDVKFMYHFEKNGIPVTDFEPYLNAPMHFAIVNENFDDFKLDNGHLGFIHTHGGPPKNAEQNSHGAEVPSFFGPDLEVMTNFVKPGKYQVFGQVKHEGKIITTAFSIDVVSDH